MARRLNVDRTENGCYILKGEYTNSNDDTQYTYVDGPFPDTLLAGHALGLLPRDTGVAGFYQLWWLEDQLWYPVNGSLWDIIPHTEPATIMYQLSVFEATKLDPELLGEGFTPQGWSYGEHVMPMTREVRCVRDMKTTFDGKPGVIINVPFTFFYIP